MRVRDLIARKGGGEVVHVGPSAEVAAAAKLLIDRGIGGLPVMRADGEVIGFISERDIVRALYHGFESVRRLPVEALMTRPAPTCQADDPLESVMRRMNRDRLRHVVVCEGNRAIGILSVGDLVKQRLEEVEMETGVLRDYVLAHRALG
jgi:CBS domain-containing protein